METANDIVVDVESLCYGRAGVARTGGKVLFVEGTAPGDRVRVHCTRDHGSYAEARLTELVEPGPQRVIAPCPIVAECGGCPWQHVAYDAQLEAKRRAVRDALERIAAIDDPPVEPVVPSPQQLGYRNRLKLRFERGRLGFYSARSHRLVPVSDCLIAEDRIRESLAQVEAFVRTLATRVLRVEIASRIELGGVVVAINSQGRLRRADVHRVRALLERHDTPMCGVVMWGRGWRRTWGDTRRRSVASPDGITIESVGAGFGQVNSAANVALVEAVASQARLHGHETVLDLYAGAGNFSLALAPRAARVIAIESDAEAAEAGARSARFHGLTNVEFRAERVERALVERLSEGADVAVVNPPRSGLGAAAPLVARLGARRIVYVSCNPTTLARDLRVLLDVGYRIERVVPFDLFPHTFHIESVCGVELT